MIRNKLKTLEKNKKKGASMVELVVAFALIGIFIVAAGSILSAYLNIYNSVNTTIQQQQISATLLERVGGVLLKCSHAYEGNPEIDVIKISEDASGKDEVEIIQATGMTVKVLITDNGRLRLNYLTEDPELIDESADETETGFGDGFYMNNIITAFEVKRVEDSSVLEVTLSLRNVKTGNEFTAVKVVDCEIGSIAAL